MVGKRQAAAAASRNALAALTCFVCFMSLPFLSALPGKSLDFPRRRLLSPLLHINIFLINVSRLPVSVYRCSDKRGCFFDFRDFSYLFSVANGCVILVSSESFRFTGSILQSPDCRLVSPTILFGIQVPFFKFPSFYAVPARLRLFFLGILAYTTRKD